jgi:hypothetical protein
MVADWSYTFEHFQSDFEQFVTRKFMDVAKGSAGVSKRELVVGEDGDCYCLVHHSYGKPFDE